MIVRCPYCRWWVLRWFYPRHVAKHTRFSNDHPDSVRASAPSEEYAELLKDVPKSYRHITCGVETRPPEYMVRKFLLDPMPYPDRIYCVGCRGFVSLGQLVWGPRDENVLDFIGGLRVAHLRTHLTMSISDRPTTVVVTERASRRFQNLSAHLSLAAPVVRVDLSQPGFESAAIADGPRLPTDVLIDAGGCRLSVAPEHATRLAGVVIDLNSNARTDSASWDERDFAISRLFAAANA